MATELLATGTSALASSDFTVAVGAQKVVYLKDAAGPDIPAGSRVLIQLKIGSEYFTVDRLDALTPAKVIIGGAETMTYRVNRELTTFAVGCEVS